MNYTLTRDGRIYHMKHPTHGFMMPVKLDFYGAKPIPRKQGENYVYALPGGGVYVI